ncbi:MAG: histone-like protein [Methanosarcinaceae archaeon]
MQYIPKAPIKKIIHDAGAEKVSMGLVEEIGDRLEAYAFDLAKKAIIVCNFREEVVVRRKHLRSAEAITRERDAEK